MNELFPTQPNHEMLATPIRQEVLQAAYSGGGLAVSSTELVSLDLVEDNTASGAQRIIKIGESEYKTNLPEGATDIFEDNGNQSLIPSKIDALPVGDFVLSEEEEGSDEVGNKEVYSIDRDISIIKTDKGKALNVEAFVSSKHDRWVLNPSTETLMTEIGYVIENNAIKAFPTPETIVRTAKELGVDIQLLPEVGALSSKIYLGVFAEGKYPVSTADETYYKHDIQDDHLPAVILGGEPLKLALQDIAKQALDSGDQDSMNKITAGIDGFTARLRGVVYNGVGAAFGKEMGRNTILKAGREVGLTDEVILGILQHAQESAAKFNIEVSELY